MRLVVATVLAVVTAPAVFATQCWQPEPPAGGAPQLSAAASSDLPPHPRLRVNDSRLAALNRTIQTDPTAKAYFDGLVIYGESWLTAPHVDCTAAHMSNTQSRTTLTIQYNLGLLWRLTGDDRFAERAAQELLHVTTNCTTWDPYGLVLAEMTHAVGLGFDWLYHYLSPSRRQSIVAGVSRMGFGEAVEQYKKKAFWTNCTFNWGVVTNGGLTIGGLAFLDEPVATANVSEVLAKAAVGIQCPFGSFAPHGGWHEGSMYWQYVAEYAVATTEALRGVYGDDHGLSAAPGFNETALFRLHMNGPSQNSFDFGDSNGALSNSAAGYFMGYSALPTSNEQLRSLCAYEARRLAKLVGGYASGEAPTAGATGRATTEYNCSLIDCARLLIDYSAAGTDAEIQSLPTARLFKLSAFGWEGRNAIGFFRSAWSVESEGVGGKHAYLAFKAANGVPNHNDLDGGSFVFEAGGQRWAMDMGSDDYQLKNYFTQTLEYRYGYYRKSTAGHNTLTFNNDNIDNSNRAACSQDPGMSGRTQITLFAGTDTASPSISSISSSISSSSSDGGSSGAGGAQNSSSSSPAFSIVDLTAAYSRQNSSRVERGFAFTAGYEQLVIVDEFEFAAAGSSSVHNATWSMHTMATIAIADDDEEEDDEDDDDDDDEDGGGGGGDGRSAVLSLGGVTLHATLIEPAGATFTARRVTLLPPYEPSVGVSKLQVHLALPAARSPAAAAVPAADAGSSEAPPAAVRIAVGLSLSAEVAAEALNPLALWKAAGPFAKGGGL
jgi:hypothetical protein